MTAHKRTKTKPTKSKKTAAKKAPAAKRTLKKRLAKKTASAKTKSAKKSAPKNATVKTAAVKKVVVKAKHGGKKTTGGKTAAVPKKQIREKRESVDTLAFAPARSRSGEQSGDLQGLSDIEGADSESVDELLDEGNAFEAGVVKGVEDAGDADEQEVHTHEIPEDDVPGEYLDEE